ncbi:MULTISPECIES: helix-turn-helix domain-containing protein [Aerococcus]|uniref:helix-turn-helix domain-containing protein n=1 Tax=Aerococcus TaxID=1375 RepID=UPI0018A7D533|nr:MULTISPECIES: helix-turn-helix transcriptional regulator [Aerococcus]MCY3067641.1 helix-turn-helix domain-containing protein [Aerococcus mictus]MCY3080457.1 helix-turn-helix domain-containing protein [Aerococcus mictus]MDK8484520.1 helix-turn-helix transcriptional regulator [Aerococcus urinae]
MSFGSKLRELRKLKKINQSQLAKDLDLSLSTISTYENDVRTPDIHVATAIAKYFNVSLNELVDVKTQTTVKKEEQVKSSDIKKILNEDDYLTYGGQKLPDEVWDTISLVIDSIAEKELRKKDDKKK